MEFFLAILGMLVLKWICLLGINHLSKGKTVEEAAESNLYITIGITYILLDCCLVAFVTVIAALFIKTYLL